MKAYFNDQRASPASTGFLINGKSRPILVTARHVVTGRNNDTNKPLHPLGCLPNKLIARVPAMFETQFKWLEIQIPLWHKDGPNDPDDTPTWYEHPALGSKADVAGIPLWLGPKYLNPFVFKSDGQPSNGMSRLGPEEAYLPPANKVFILGYPFGEFGAMATAIWTSGTIASEYGNESHPYFYVDARTRQGQSGAPVILYDRTGDLWPFRGTYTNGEPAYILAGLYTGRIHEDADIGKVWKRTVLVDLVESIE